MALSQFQQFVGVLWLAIIFIGYFYKKYELLSINAVLGIYLGLELANESFVFMLFMVMIDLWLLYDSLVRVVD